MVAHVVSGDLPPVVADCLVAGRSEAGADRSSVVNPGDLSDVVGSAPKLDADAVDRTVRYAAAVQPGSAGAVPTGAKRAGSSEPAAAF